MFLIYMAWPTYLIQSMFLRISVIFTNSTTIHRTDALLYFGNIQECDTLILANILFFNTSVRHLWRQIGAAGTYILPSTLIYVR